MVMSSWVIWVVPSSWFEAVGIFTPWATLTLARTAFEGFYLLTLGMYLVLGVLQLISSSRPPSMQLAGYLIPYAIAGTLLQILRKLLSAPGILSA